MSGNEPRISIQEPGTEFRTAAAQCIAECIVSAIQARGRCSLMLAGGSTPRAIYEELAVASLDWKQVDIYFGDERCVPPADADSNYRMAMGALFGGSPPRATVNRMMGEATDLEAEALRYASLLPPAVDLLILGVGEDGHTASLFPGSPVLQEATRRVAVVTGPKPPNPRLTITPPVISAARKIVVLVAGEGKSAVLRGILQGPLETDRFPAQLALRGIWVLDKDAAKELAKS